MTPAKKDRTVDAGLGKAFARQKGTKPPKSGKYEIAAKRGPLPGRYRVSITANRETGRDVVVGGLKGSESEQFIPANYNVKTELEVEIKPGRNTADFTLTSGK